MEKLIGRQFGRYQLLETLGQGGMALVYRAQDMRLERMVAIKILLPGYQHSDTFIQRFEREAKALAQLTHPNIVPLLDYGDFEGMPYLVMTYLPGGSLKSLMGVTRSPGKAAHLLMPIADALAYAHRRGIIHRDVKPANILLTEDGQPMLADFGIVKLLESKNVESLTAIGVGIGTPDYMSPEQAQGQPIDARSDIYSLGIILYEMVTGRKPFEGDTPMSLLYKHISEAVPPPRTLQPDLPVAVEAVILKSLAKTPDERYASMDAFKTAMVGFLGRDSERTQIASSPLRPADVTEVARDGWEELPEFEAEPQPVADVTVAEATEVLLGTGGPDRADAIGAVEGPTEIEEVYATEIAAPDVEPQTPPWEQATFPKESAQSPETRVSTLPMAKPSTVKAEKKKVRWWLPVVLALSGLIVIFLGAVFIIKPYLDQRVQATVPPKEEEVVVEEDIEEEEPPAQAEVIVPHEVAPLNVVRIGEPLTLDPTLAYEIDAWEVIGNVYESLVFFEREHPDRIIPQVADEFRVSPDATTYNFHIREGIRFHNGAALTASDAAYTLQRALLTASDNTPQWMLAQAILGAEITDITLLIEPGGEMIRDRGWLQQTEPGRLLEICARVKGAIEANDEDGSLAIHLAQPWAPFLSTLAAPFTSIIDQDWVTQMGGWDGSCETWQNYYAQSTEENPLSYQVNGSGPYRLEGWEPGSGMMRLQRNDSYWRHQPGWENGPTGDAFFGEVIIRFVSDLEMRLEILQASEADLVSVNWMEYGEADNLVGELCIERDEGGVFTCERQNDQPTRLMLARTTHFQPMIFFNYNIQMPEGQNPFIGSGRLDGEGIPVDFFTDFSIRYAFQACFAWDDFNQAVFRGYGLRNTTLALPGMMGYDPGAPATHFNPEECRQAFQSSAWRAEDGRSLWDTGFKLMLPFREDRVMTLAAAEILAGNINALNPAFHVQPMSLIPEDYSYYSGENALPIFLGGWQDDVYDPYYRYSAFLTGYFAWRMSLPDDLRAPFEEMLWGAATEPDAGARSDWYNRINWRIDEQALFIFTGFEREHIYTSPRLAGYYYNPAFYGNYYYALSGQ